MTISASNAIWRAGNLCRLKRDLESDFTLATMSKRWPDCVVTVVDVIGIKNVAQTEGSKASKLMRKLHSLAQKSMSNGMIDHEFCYCWNDSVLLLAMWDGKVPSAHRILSEVSDLKRRIDKEIGKSYAISVKGRAFPVDCSGVSDRSRCLVLRSSSYAMGNCFLIEAEAKKLGLKDDWYVDSRLKKATGVHIGESFSIKLLPSHQRREIMRFRGYIPPCLASRVNLSHAKRSRV